MRRILMVLCLMAALSAYAQRGEEQGELAVRIMSYNIRNGIGIDQVYDLDRTVAAINRAMPDVVALQELDSVTLRNGKKDVLKELAERMLMHRIYAPAITYQGGKYGIGILSKEKPLGYRCYHLPGREEQRALLVAEFKRYVVCCTHFSLTEADREASVDTILKIVAGMQKPLFLAGDLNAFPESGVLKRLKKKFQLLSNTKQLTFPADTPRVCIDYILGYTANGQSYATLQSRVADEPVASDHRPVVVDVRFKTEVSEIFRTNPYLQRPAEDVMTVCWLTNVPVYSWVEYGTAPDSLRRAHTVVDGQVVSNNTIHKIRLERLKPGTTYYYRACSREILYYGAYSKVFGETAITAIKTFIVPRSGECDFTALIFNDLHKQHKILDALYDQVKDIKYDMVFFNGDVIDDPRNESEAVRSLSYYNNKVGADRIPVFYLRGNHEIRNAYSIELRSLFDYVGDKTYGAFSWGDTRFVMLDCGEDKADSSPVFYGLNDFTRLLNDQTGFLKTELVSKAFKKAGRRVLIHHIPLYCQPEKTYLPGLKLWGGMLERAPFDIALCGHTHEYVFHPKGEAGNNFPVAVGGGYSLNNATVMVLEKRGKTLTLKVLDSTGKILKETTL